MAIAKMTICHWGLEKTSLIIPNPSWDQVRDAILRLNNEDFNDLYLQPDLQDSETYLCVGGGAGRYLVTGSIGNEIYPTAVLATRSAEPKELLTVGGQEGFYPANWILDLETALQAVEAYCLLGRPGGKATWVNA